MGTTRQVGDLNDLELELLSKHGLRARIVHRPYAPEGTRWLAVELGDNGLARQGGARGEGPSPEAARAALLRDRPEPARSAPPSGPGPQPDARDAPVEETKPKKRSVNWDQVDLGQRTDADIARELRVPVNKVTQARRRRGIARCDRRLWLTDEVRARLGAAPDPVVAAEFGLHTHQIWRARNDLGIPPLGRVRSKHWLNDATRARLGTVPDSRLAGQVGVCVSTIARTRRRLGIASFRSVRWLNDEVRARLGRETDARIARELGVHSETVARHRRALGIPSTGRWCTPQVEARLGTVPDADLAAELGVAKTTVASARRKRGIPAMRAPRTPRRPWLTDAIRTRLEQAPDAQVAQEAGVAVDTVRRARSELGIPTYRRGQARPIEGDRDEELSIRLVDHLAVNGPMDLDRLATEVGVLLRRVADTLDALADEGFVAVDDADLWDLT